MEKIRKKHILGAIEISVIAVLTLALIIMFASYCFFTSSSSSVPSYKDTLYAESIFAPFDDTKNEKQLISPSFIGICFEKALSPASPSTRNGLINEILPFVSHLFSDVSTTLEFSSPKSAFEYVENEIAQHSEYLYISFPCDIPASCVSTLLGADTVRESAHAFLVKDLYIFCDESGYLSGICTDKNGNAATLAARTKAPLSFETLHRFADDSEEMTRFEFVTTGERKFPVFSSSVSNFNIIAYNESGADILENEQGLRDIVSSFGFNPNNTRFFRTQNAITYVEQFGELTISENGDVLYTRESIGVPLSELCGKIKENYSFADKINAAYNIISSLDRNTFGGYSALCVDDISYNDGLLNIGFSYYADGICIESGEDAAKLTFDSNSLVSANVSAARYAVTNTTYSDIPQKLLFTLFKTEFEDNLPHSFLPVYTANGGDEIYSAKYAFVFDSEVQEGVSEK